MCTVTEQTVRDLEGVLTDFQKKLVLNPKEAIYQLSLISDLKKIEEVRNREAYLDLLESMNDLILQLANNSLTHSTPQS